MMWRGLATGGTWVIGVLLAACSGARVTSGDEGDGGEAGAAPTVENTAGAGAGQAGEGNPVRDPVAAAANVHETEVVLERADLEGASFLLTGWLCPKGSWSEDDPFEDHAFDSQATSLPGVHVRRATGGGLELVTSTGHEGLSEVHVGALRRAGLGYDVDDVPSCARSHYVFENEYETERHVAPKLHLIFVRQTETAPLRVLVATTAPDGESLQSWGDPDLTVSGFHHVDVRGIFGLDEIGNGGFDVTFALEEPAVSPSEISVTDRVGAPVEWQPLRSLGFLVGFRVQDTLSSDAHLSLRLFDLAGNESLEERPYPGLTLEPLSGDFEAEVDFFTSDRWNDGVGGLDCGYTHAGPSPRTELAYEDEPELPPIAGQQSFWLGQCGAYFRVARAAGATHLRFEARAVRQAWPYAEPPGLSVSLDSLDAGGMTLSHSQPIEWPTDATLATPELSISTVQTVEVALPETGDDLLVSIQPDVHLWLDDLRVE